MTSSTVGVAYQEAFEGAVRIAGFREFQLDWTADPAPAAPHSLRIDSKVQRNIEQNKFTFRLDGCPFGPERTLIHSVVDRLHRLAPFLKVGRSGQKGRVLNGLFVGVEVPIKDPHFVLKLDHISEQFRRLIGSEARDEKEQALNRLPLVGKEEIPLAELLIDIGKKGQRYTFEQSFVQSVLKCPRQ